MPIHFISGDLFDNEHHAQVFAHGCNCQGSMGAGVARTIRARYPEMYEEYRHRCKAEPRRFNLGDCWLWKADDQPWVFNLGTQEGYWRSRASYEAIETALKEMRRQADVEGITTVAMPRIGVGYGGLSWKKVRVIVEEVFADWPGTLVVYEEYVPGRSADTSTPQAEPEPSRTSPVRDGSDSPRGRSRRKRHTSNPTESDRNEGDGTMNAIHFYRVSEAYGGFSNFSPHPVTLKGKTWPTSEHYFQAQKFAGTPDEEEVRQAGSPMIAARMGRSRQRPLRKDWDLVKDSIMHEAVLAKFTQHADLQEVLLATGDAVIVEHTKNDAYWGDGGDGRGQNKLGRILMRVREELRSAADAGGDARGR
jgi:N-glycosidase YbiA